MGRRGKKESGGASERKDSTLMFPVHEPRIEQFGFRSARLKLYSLQRYLRGFKLVSSGDPRGFNFDAFIRNMAGQKTIRISEREYEFVCTGHGMYLVSPESQGLMELAGRACPLDLSKSSLITDGDDTIRIVRITSSEMDAIETASGMGKQRGGFAPRSPGDSVSIEELKANLRRCRLISCEEGFDMDAFVSGLTYAAVFNDIEERLHFAAIGSGDSTYAIYVNHNPQEHPENKLVFAGESKDGSCYVYRIEVVS